MGGDFRERFPEIDIDTDPVLDDNDVRFLKVDFFAQGEISGKMVLGWVREMDLGLSEAEKRRLDIRGRNDEDEDEDNDKGDNEGGSTEATT